jgi:hypothetical protein
MNNSAIKRFIEEHLRLIKPETPEEERERLRLLELEWIQKIQEAIK